MNDTPEKNTISPQKKSKQYKVKPTLRQRQTVAILLEKGGGIGSAMRSAGYSDATAKNPQHLTERRGYQELLKLEKLSDSDIAKRHRRLTYASHIEKMTLPYASMSKKQKGRKKLKIVDRRIDHDDIRKMVEGTPGCELVMIYDDDRHSYHHVVYRVPNDMAQKSGLEMAMKARNLLEPDKFEISLQHVTSPEEKAAVESALKIIN